MKLKRNILTIILIVFVLFFIYGAYSNAQMSIKLNSACDDIQRGILSESPGMFDTTEQFVSCISQRDDARIKISINVFSLIIFIFLALLSWKIDKLKEKK